MMQRLAKRVRGVPWYLVLALSLPPIMIGLWFGSRRVSYLHPGPALALIAFGVVVGLAGWVIASLRDENIELATERARGKEETIRLAQQLADAEADTLQRIPTIIGIELLVQRWLQPGQTLSQKDSEMVFEQIRIMLSVARFESNNAGVFRILKVFPGTKIERSVLLIQAGINAPQVLKIDRADNLRSEFAMYQAHVKQRLGNVPGQPHVCRAKTQIDAVRWGAITYNLVGYNAAADTPLGQLQTLGEFIVNCKSNQRTDDALHHVFRAINPWWGQRERLNMALTVPYARLSTKRTQLEDALCKVGQCLHIQALEHITSNEPHIALGDSLVLRNPFHWVKEAFSNADHATPLQTQLGAWATDPNQRYDATIHGDFHLGNILISEGAHGDLQAWLIDFPHTQIGPIFQDLARIEADIKFGLFPIASADYAALYALERRILPAFTTPPAPVGTPGATEQAGAGSELDLIEHAIATVRAKAQHYLTGLDARPYYLALLHATLPMVAYRDRSPQQKLHAFISSALLCEYLGA